MVIIVWYFPSVISLVLIPNRFLTILYSGRLQLHLTCFILVWVTMRCLKIKLPNKLPYKFYGIILSIQVERKPDGRRIVRLLSRSPSPALEKMSDVVLVAAFLETEIKDGPLPEGLVIAPSQRSRVPLYTQP